MSGHKMTVQPAIGAQRAFQIDERTGFGELQIRQPPRFREQIELRELVEEVRVYEASGDDRKIPGGQFQTGSAVRSQ